MVFWNDISEKQSLRRLDATERVAILNSKLGLKLVPATPIKIILVHIFGPIVRAPCCHWILVKDMFSCKKN